MEKAAKYSPDQLAIGIVYREMRESKGFSQTEAAGDEISIPQLSNFENGRTIVGTHHFIALLSNINANMLEFQNIYNQHLKSKDLLLFSSEIADAVLQHNVVQLKMLSKQIKQRLTMKPNDKKLKLDDIRVKSALYFIDPSYSITKDELNFLLDYFYHLKEWGLYDIQLLGHCAQFIDPIKLSDLTYQIINPMQANSELHYTKLATIQCLLNIINVFVDNRIYEPARRLIKYLEESNIHEYFMFEKLTLIYNKANYSYRTGDKTALEIMEKCKEILEFCNCSETATQVANELNKLKKA